MDNMYNFNQAFTQLRKETKLSIDEFCADYNKRFNGNINSDFVLKIENGDSRIDYNEAKILAEYFNVNRFYILGLITDKNPKLTDSEQIYAAFARGIEWVSNNYLNKLPNKKHINTTDKT